MNRSKSESTSKRPFDLRPRRRRGERIRALEALEQRTLMTITPGAPIQFSAVEGSLFIFTPTIATFSDDNNPTHDTSVYSVAIDYGDGNANSLPISTVNYNASTNLYEVGGANDYEEEGFYLTSVGVTSTDGNSALISGSALVDDAPLVDNGSPTSITGVEGNSFTGVVARFADTDGTGPTDPTEYRAFINWGDGSALSLGTVSTDGGNFKVNGTHTYAEETAPGKPYAAQVTIIDTDGRDTPIGVVPGSRASLVVNVAATVNDAPITATGLGYSGVEAKLGAGVVASFTDGNPTAPLSDFKATIDWGDGTALDTKTFLSQPGGVGKPFNVTGVHIYAEEGTYTPIVRIFDIANTAAPAATVSAKVIVADAPLTAGSPVAFSGTEGAALVNQTIGNFNDPAPELGAGEYTATVTWGDGSAATAATVVSTGGTGFAVKGSHTYALFGTYAVKIHVVDNPAAVDLTATATVGDAALTATLVPIAPVEGSAFSGTVANFKDAAGPGGNPNQFTATISWGDGGTTVGTVTADGAGGFNVGVSGATAHTYSEEGKYPLQVIIADVGGASTTVSGTVTVADAALTGGASANLVAFQGSPFSGQVATFTDANPNAPLGDFKVSINWGDGSGADTTTGVVTQPGAPGDKTFVISGTHFYTSKGVFTVTVTVTDNPSTTAVSDKLTVTVPPAIVTTQNFTGNENQSISPIVATFFDPNPFEPNQKFIATINWGDGTPATAGVVTRNAVTTQFTVQGTHTYAEEGTYTPTVTISEDNGDGAITVSLKATIADPPPVVKGTTFNAVEGASFKGIIGSFTDPGTLDPAGQYVVRINWGDGTALDTTTAVLIANGTGYNIQGTHTYGEEGAYSGVTITVFDADGKAIDPKNPPPSGVATSLGLVADAPITGIAIANILDEGPNHLPTGGTPLVEGKAFQAHVAFLTDADPLGEVADYNATIVWGDGSVTTGSIAAAGSQFVIDGSHTYEEEGTYTVKVLLGDFGGSTTSALSTAVVQDAPIHASPATATMVEGSTFNGLVATFTDEDPHGTTADYTATIAWPDGTNSPGTIAPDPFLPGVFDVIGTYLPQDDGTGSIIVVINDHGATDTAISTANILPGSLAGTGGVAIKGIEGAAIGTTTLAAFTFSNSFAPIGDFTASVDWGDGSTTAGSVVTDGSGGYLVQGNHTYVDKGTYTPKITILDEGDTTRALVVTDSAAIADAPLIALATAPTFIATEGSTSTAQVVASFNDSGGLDPAAEYVTTINWGDFSASTPGVLVARAGGTGYDVVGSHNYAEEGTYHLSVTIVDADGVPVVAGDASLVINTTIAQVADAALVASTTANPLTVVEGGALTNKVFGTFTDNDPGGVPGDYVAVVDFGDGTAKVTLTGNATNFVKVANTASTYNVVTSHTYAEEGTYTVSVAVFDTDGKTFPVTPNPYVTTTITNTKVTVSDAPLTSLLTARTLKATEGATTGSQILAVFKDADPGAVVGDYKVTIDWKDGTPLDTGAVITPAGASTFIVYGVHNYGEEGNYTPVVTIVDTDGAPIGAPGRSSVVANNQTVAVADAPVSSIGTPNIQPAVAGLNTGDVVVGTFKDADPNGQQTATHSDYAATIDWGDGTSLVTVPSTAITKIDSGFNVHGNHTYANRGAYNVTVTFYDTDGVRTLANSVNAVANNTTFRVESPAVVGSAALVSKAAVKAVAPASKSDVHAAAIDALAGNLVSVTPIEPMVSLLAVKKK